MKTSNRFARVVRIGVLLLLLAGIAVQQNGAPAAQAQSSGSLALFPITLASLGPTTSGGVFYSTVGASGDWVAYAQGLYGCGHCNGSINTIYLRNVVDGSKFKITASTLSAGRGDSTFGAEGVHFVAPYLLWRQPMSKASAGGNSNATLTAGDFDCSICYFNVQTGKGGAVAALQPMDPNKDGTILPLAVDESGSGRALAIVDTPAGSTLYLLNLGSGDLKKIALPNPLSSGDISNAVFSGAAIAWNGRTGPDQWGLFRYIESEDRLLNLFNRPEVYRLDTNGTHLFWNSDTQDVVISADLATSEMDALQLPGSAGNFEVSGNRIAWTVFQGFEAPQMLHVDQIAPRQELLQQAVASERQPGNTSRTSLADFGSDKILFFTSESGPESGPPLDQRIEMAWLTTPDPSFLNVWSKADTAVAEGTAARSWLWGPQPRYLGYEAYAEGPGGRHLVYYYDKSRMEVNNPQANPNDPYYVTNGLLVVELISGKMQLGDTTSIEASAPATMPVAGDPRLYNPLTPDYATLAGVASLNGDMEAANRVGQPVDDAIDIAGKVSKDTAHAALTSYTQYMDQTGHNIPQVFSDYLAKMPATYGFDWTFVLGYPITEAYWTQMRVGGKDYPVLIQAFQRRVLTYVPDFDPTWQVQQGNVGQHYLQWRYKLNQ